MATVIVIQVTQSCCIVSRRGDFNDSNYSDHNTDSFVETPQVYMPRAKEKSTQVNVWLNEKKNTYSCTTKSETESITQTKHALCFSYRTV